MLGDDRASLRFSCPCLVVLTDDLHGLYISLQLLLIIVQDGLFTSLVFLYSNSRTLALPLARVAVVEQLQKRSRYVIIPRQANYTYLKAIV
jgi:hypothetical protein